MTTTLRVDLGRRGYDIVVGGGVLARTGEWLAPVLRRPRVLIVTDETVAGLYLASLQAALDKAGIAHRHLVLPPGEATKSLERFPDLLDALLGFAPDRLTTLVALGGGVVGDVAGFAASVLLRGIDYVQIPTTLLAQVDSSVGGKTGLNTRQGKNLIGSFHQPRLVLADTGTLATLPRRELLAGYAETLKYGILGHYPFFVWLEEHGPKALAGDPAAIAHMVHESCKAKADIVAEDEREAGVRALLNLGHTFAHAFEAESGYDGRMLHGEAVAVGIVLSLKLSTRRGLIETQDAERVARHLREVGLPTRPSELGSFDANTLIDRYYQDKKALGGGLTFVLVEKIGKAVVCHDVTRGELDALLAQAG